MKRSFGFLVALVLALGMTMPALAQDATPVAVRKRPRHS